MKKSPLWKIISFTIMMIAVGCLESHGFDKSILTDVRVEHGTIKDVKTADVHISWQQSSSGLVNVLVCDLDGNIIRKLVSDDVKTAGSHVVQWDGKDLNGRYVPVGAYLPIISVKTELGQIAVHNPTSSDWGREFLLEPPVYDARRGKIAFQLPQPALCLLRIGKTAGGPCYGTLLNWVPRPAGNHEVPWNGRDAQNAVDLGARPDLQLSLITIALPEGSITVTSSPATDYPPDAQYQSFPLHPSRGVNVAIHAQHHHKTCRDFEITAQVNNSKSKKDGQQNLAGIVDITVSMTKGSHYQQLKKEIFEIYLFVDDQFILEEKKEDVPASVSLNTLDLTNGPHFLTVALRTLEDHMGTYTMRINVEN